MFCLLFWCSFGFHPALLLLFFFVLCVAAVIGRRYEEERLGLMCEGMGIGEGVGSCEVASLRRERPEWLLEKGKVRGAMDVQRWNEIATARPFICPSTPSLHPKPSARNNFHPTNLAFRQQSITPKTKD